MVDSSCSGLLRDCPPRQNGRQSAGGSGRASCEAGFESALADLLGRRNAVTTHYLTVKRCTVITAVGLADLDINELCERADVTPRTVHFYVQQGLLPPAGSPGPGARYTEGHVSRIKLIRLLQKQHLPLSEIAKRTRGLSDEQVTGLIAETKQRRAESKGSALDYIRGVLAEPTPNERTPNRGAASKPIGRPVRTERRRGGVRRRRNLLLARRDRSGNATPWPTEWSCTSAGRSHEPSSASSRS